MLTFQGYRRADYRLRFRSDFDVQRGITLAVVSLLTLALGVRLLFLVKDLAVNVMFSDQWQTFTPLFEGQGFWSGYVRQHGPHRLGIAFVVSMLLMKASSWNTIIESYFAASVLIISALLALRLKWVLFRKIVLSDLTVALLLLSPIHYETILLVPSAYHSIVPLALLLGIALTLVSRNKFIRFILGSVLTSFSIFCGFGLVTGMVMQIYYVAVAIAASHSGVKKAALPVASALIPLATWIVFFQNYEFGSGAGPIGFPHQPLSDYLVFICMMFAGPFQLIGERYAPIGGLVLLACLVSVLYAGNDIWRHRSESQPTSCVVLCLASVSLIYAEMTALGRIQLGIQYSQGSRYMALLMPGMLSIYFTLQVIKSNLARNALSSSCALITAVCCLNLGQVHGQVLEGFQEGKQSWLAAYRETKELNAANTRATLPLLGATNERLEYLKTHRLSFFADVSSDNYFFPSTTIISSLRAESRGSWGSCP